MSYTLSLLSIATVIFDICVRLCSCAVSFTANVSSDDSGCQKLVFEVQFLFMFSSCKEASFYTAVFFKLVARVNIIS